MPVEVKEKNGEMTNGKHAQRCIREYTSFLRFETHESGDMIA